MQNMQHLMKSYKTKKIMFDWADVIYPLNCYVICEEEDSWEFLYYKQNYLFLILSI